MGKDFRSTASHGISKIALYPTAEGKHIRVITSPRDEEVPGTTYKVTEILFAKFIGTADITFRISKSWLDDNDLTVEDLVLYHQDSDLWEVQNTAFLEATDNYEYLLLEGTEEQGYFAVSTEPEPEPEPEVEVEEDDEEEAPTGMATADLSGWLIGIVVILALIAIAGFGYYFYDSQQFRSAI